MPAKKLPDKEFRWTPELAYVIGLLVTDGHLSKDRRHIVFRSTDYQLMEEFRKCLALSNLIAETKSDRHSQWHRKPAYRIQFGSVQFYHWLQKIGFTDAKTYTIDAIKIPRGHFRDFLRGHLDGDGSIVTYRDYYNTFKNPKYIYDRLFVRFLSASGAHIEWLRKEITALTDLHGHIWQQKPNASERKVGLWSLKFAKKESLKLLAWIYYDNDLPCLKRKRAIAQRFLPTQTTPLLGVI